ncbi:MAG: hypothetical protein DWI58_06930 [Chloroflexi bacterium]|nr:MAG: hypothetical protein DWI58_06930 [Chloroflexota bacterium]
MPLTSIDPALGTYTTLVVELRDALDHQDGPTIERLTAGTLLYAPLGRLEGVNVNVRPSLPALLAQPALHAGGVVRGVTPRSPSLVFGVLIENWGTRTLSVLADYGGAAPPGAPITVPQEIRADAVVFVFYSDSLPEQNQRIRFFGLAPAEGFVKVSDIP